MSEPVIRRLEPALLDDYLRFFDRDAFADNPDWSSCYCNFYHFCGGREAWDNCTAAQNRAAVADRITKGETGGWLAYVDGRPAAWCQATLPGELGNLEHILSGYQTPPGTGVVTCFVVSAPFRRQGMARRLLQTACDDFAARGLTAVEAYPYANAQGDAHNYPGPVDLYLEAGFHQVQDLKSRVVMRKMLAAG